MTPAKGLMHHSVWSSKVHGVRPWGMPSSLATAEQGAGGLDCELQCAPATLSEWSMMQVFMSFRDCQCRSPGQLALEGGAICPDRFDHSSQTG